jgi:hypothetical protein
VRTKAVFILVLTLVSSTTSVTGQQHALPPVTFRTATPEASTLPPATTARTEPTVYLDALPIRDDSGQLTITEAARNNDYTSFETLYTAAKSRGERVAQFDALHELWSWSMTSPIGAFYGPDLYERFAGAYPGFADYIEDYKLVDSRGNVFYPTAETRQFLLDHAIRGTRAPRVDIARTEPLAQPERSYSRGESAAPRTTTSDAPPVSRATKPRSRLQKSDATSPKPAFAKPAVAVPAPVLIAAAPAVVPVPVSASASAPVQQPSAPKPVLSSMISPSPRSPVVKPATEGAIGRGLLLLLIGIVGLGVLAAILRAPQEQPLTIMPAAGENADDNVEPIRKAESTPQATQQEKKNSANRANGSR